MASECSDTHGRTKRERRGELEDEPSAAHHMVQVAGDIGEGEPRVAVDADLRGVAVLAHADGPRVVDGVVRDLPRGALRADDACACKPRLSILAGVTMSSPLSSGMEPAGVKYA